jgi:uncharacterized protein YjbI with pentapeptide repeats
MADEEQLAILRQGTEAWNAWRENHPDIRPDLRGAILSGAALGADLRVADLRGANLDEADLFAAVLVGANLFGALLTKANLGGANLRRANLGGANLAGANLRGTTLVGTHLINANITGCRVYGMAAWDLHLEGARQADLIITREDQPEITVEP